MVDQHERGERFARDIASLRIADPAPGRHHDLWLRIGSGLMVGGLALSAFGYYKSQAASVALVQRDALALGMAGVAATIVGATVWLRFSMTKVLRFWLARVSMDLQTRPVQPVRPVRRAAAAAGDRPPPPPPTAAGPQDRRPPAPTAALDGRSPVERPGGRR